MNFRVSEVFRCGWVWFLVALLALSSLSPAALAAEKAVRQVKGDTSLFGKDVFQAWGRWKKTPDRMPFYPDGDVFAYHAYMGDVRRVASDKATKDCPPLPDTLIIPPGTYQFRGWAFTLKQEGLYRFLDVCKGQQQRIVYRNDLDGLLSGIAWIAAHGKSDSGKSRKELAEQAKTRKLFMTCGSVSSLASGILKERDIRARSATSLTLGHWNTYDNGHAMIEVYRKDIGKWVLYDIDNNSFFTWQGKPLSMVEFAYAVMGDYPYEIKPLANDTRLDVSNFKGADGADYAFLCERINTGIRQWYRRVVEVPMLYDSSVGRCFFDQENRRRIESNNKSFKYLEKSEFQRIFYGDAPGEE